MRHHVTNSIRALGIGIHARLTIYTHLKFGLICLAIVLTSFVAFGQTKDDIMVTGFTKVQNSSRKLEGVTIKVTKNGSTDKTAITNSSGKFEFIFDYENDYMLTYSKEGYVSKKVFVSTKGIPAVEKEKGFFAIPFEVSLFEEMEDLDIKILDQPIAKFKFDANASDIVYDPEYTKSIQDKLNALLKQLEAKLEEAERKLKEAELNRANADALVKKGDTYVSQSKFPEAVGKYDEALALLPGDATILAKKKAAQDQMGDAAAKAEEERLAAEREAKYKDILGQADKLFLQKSYEPSKKLFQEASEVKPQEAYPKSKIAEIDKILGEAKELEDSYAAAIKKADEAFTASNWKDAKASYNSAVGLKPAESYPKDRIKECDQKLLEQANKEDSYNIAIKAGDAAFQQKKWPEAKTSYQQALQIKSGEKYPTDQIALADKAIADEKAKGDLYNNAIAKADAAFANKTWEEAKSSYQEALGIKPTEAHPKARLLEIDKAIAAEKAKESEYKTVIALADQAFEKKSWEDSKAQYNKALGIKPGEPYPKERIAKIEELVAAIGQVEADYKKTIATADAEFAKNNWPVAKTAYEKGLQLKPTETYPVQQITLIDKKLAETAALDEKYKGLIAKADQEFKSKSWTAAKASYTEASGIKPDQTYPKDQLAAIAKALGDEKAQQDKYDGVIAAADKQFQAGAWADAKQGYNNALALKPDEKYPKDQIGAIDGKLQKLDADYAAANKRGDAAIADKKWSDAKTAYNEALAIKPAEQYPKDKLKEIDGFIAQEKQAGEKYEALISQADAAFDKKNWPDAQAKYTEGLSLKPAESYPKTQLAKIAEVLAVEKEKEDNYASAISKGDMAFQQKDWDRAKVAYNEATSIKINEAYPKDQLQKITEAIAGAKAKEDQYNTAIASGDAAFAQKSWDKARASYQEAIKIKPEEKYPPQQISEIDKALGAEKVLQDRYNAAITKGDNAFNTSSWEEAKTAYTEASGLKPAEAYPKDRLNEISKAIASEQALDAKYQEELAKADADFNIKEWAKAKSGYNKALKIKPAEAYPKDRLAEIDKVLAEGEAKEKQYQDAIAVGDNAFKGKSWEAAKTAYNDALGIKPSEKYPQDQISAIDKALEMQRIEAERLAAEQSLDAEYKAVLADADGQFGQKNWTNAEAGYKKALGLKPDQSYPKDQLKKVDQALLAAKARAEYDAVIASADAAFAGKTWEDAKTKYKEALALQSSEAYPKQQLAKIDEMINAERSAAERLAEEQKVKEQYDAAIAIADKAFQAKSWTDAIAKYKEAQGIKPGEAYPPQQLAAIESAIAAEEAASVKQAEAEALDKSYLAALNKADGLFAKNAWDPARKSYEEALGFKPNERYPKEQISAIEAAILAEAAEAKRLAAAQDEATKLAEKQRIQQAYDKAIIAADQAFKSKDWDKARDNYIVASDLKKDEQYPEQQLDAIDAAIEAEQAALKAEMEELKKLSEEQAQRDQYNEFIVKADAAFKKKAWPEAKTAYTRAMGVFPHESYPPSQIEAIDAAIEAAEAEARRLELQKNQAELDRAYGAAIQKGDQAFKTKSWKNAQDGYREALALKPAERYPADQLIAVETALREEEEEAARIAKESAEKMSAEAKLEADYKAAIKQADTDFKAKSWDAAKAGYNEALELKPSEKYPKDQLIAIAEGIKREIEEQSNKARQELDAGYNAAITEADKAFENRAWNAAATGYNNALGYKPNEKYPKDRLSAIEVEKEKDAKRLAENASQAELLAQQKAMDDAYDAAISRGDASFDRRSWQDAKAAYREALKVKPDERYPQNQLAAIEKGMQEDEENKAKQLSEAQRIANQKALEDSYNNAIAKGDMEFRKRSWDTSKAAYEEALGFKPTEEYPKGQLRAIMDAQRAEKLERDRLAGVNSTDESYKDAIARGDNAYLEMEYPKAILAYKEALGHKPNEQYPKERIEKIEKEIKESERMGAEVNLQRQFAAAVERGDNSFAAKNWFEAESAYKEALGIKPGAEYPTRQLRALRQAIEQEKYEAEMRDKQKTDAERLAEQQALRNKYQAAINKADAAFEERAWPRARTQYNEALKVISEEQYPKDRLMAIDEEERKDKEREAQAKIDAQNRAEQDAVNNAYKQFISKADAAFNQKDWVAAQTGYQSAIGIKPEERYPKDRIAEIERKKAEELANADQAERNRLAALEAKRLAEEEAKRKAETASKKAADEEARRLALLEAQRAAEEKRLAYEQEEKPPIRTPIQGNRVSDEKEKEAERYQREMRLKQEREKLEAINVVKGNLADTETDYVRNASDRLADVQENFHNMKLDRQEDRAVQESDWRANLTDFREWKGELAGQQANWSKQDYDQITEQKNQIKNVQEQKETEKRKGDAITNISIDITNDRKFSQEEFVADMSKKEGFKREEEMYRVQEISEMKEEEKRQGSLVTRKSVSNYDDFASDVTQFQQDIQRKEGYNREEAVESVKDLRKGKELEKLKGHNVTTQSVEDEKRWEGEVMSFKAEMEQKEGFKRKDEMQKVAELAAGKETEKQKGAALTNSSVDQERQWEGEVRAFQAEMEKKEGFKRNDEMERVANTRENKEAEKVKGEGITAESIQDERNWEAGVKIFQETMTAKEGYKREDEVRRVEEIAGNKETEKQRGQDVTDLSIGGQRTWEQDVKSFQREMEKKEGYKREEEVSKVDMLARNKEQEKNRGHRVTAGSISQEQQREEEIKSLQRTMEAKEGFKREQEMQNVATKQAQVEELNQKGSEISTMQREITAQKKTDWVTEKDRQAQQDKEKLLAANQKIGDYKEEHRAYTLEKREVIDENYRELQSVQKSVEDYHSVRGSLANAKILANKQQMDGIVFNQPKSYDKYHMQALAEKYPQGVTEETYTEGTKVVIRRIVIDGNRADDYQHVVARWGDFYFKNGKSITRFLWDKETMYME